jgi:hypothetical protein
MCELNIVSTYCILVINCPFSEGETEGGEETLEIIMQDNNSPFLFKWGATSGSLIAHKLSYCGHSFSFL